ncbi:hypothetical protein OPV22_024846 [Ensete ventricosum]|uniref:Uncharacterized protein n=1 Tax=Ensete ventricosum TaxID=4639 RepID=A0AAV8QAZ5_ENSVE|nr:hypothetical protein OPV22_024846 [Ensete ventricosum]
MVLKVETCPSSIGLSTSQIHRPSEASATGGIGFRSSWIDPGSTCCSAFLDPRFLLSSPRIPLSPPQAGHAWDSVAAAAGVCSCGIIKIHKDPIPVLFHENLDDAASANKRLNIPPPLAPVIVVAKVMIPFPLQRIRREQQILRASRAYENASIS